MHFLDFESGQWSQRSGPGARALDDVLAGPDGFIGVRVAHVSAIPKYAQPFISRDAGQNWQQLPPPKEIQGQGPPVSSADRSLLMIAGSFETPVCLASTDGGTTWVERGKMPFNLRLIALPSGLLMAVERGGYYNYFSIHVSRDGGQTWTSEYSNFDHDADRIERERESSAPKPVK
jgi:photosystem II stability/assembly factor-like uncharacterized protein